MYTILIADDHELVRDTLAAYLSTDESWEVETVEDFDEAYSSANKDGDTHLAVLDYNMAGMDGLQGIDKMKEGHPNTKVVLMSGIATPETARAALRRGADGFFPKSMSAPSLVNAVKFVLSGERFFPADWSEASEATSGKNFMGLSPRETETLRKLCNGSSNKEIARDLGLQEVTIKLHVTNILKKLGATNRTQAALIAQSNGFH
ncbi:MAG: response regulator transcription factor [Pseudomonadota bacterium]